MSLTQNEKIRQVTETTMVIGVDIASETHWARAFDWRGLELGEVISFENSAEGFQQFTRWASELAMATQMNIPVLGIVENMSYVKCPDCGKEIKIFGESKLMETAQNLGLDVLGRLPIDPVMAQLVDKGEFERFSNDYLTDAVQKLETMCAKTEG